MPEFSSSAIIELYVKSQLSGTEIAEKFKISPKQIYRILERNGVSRRSRILQNELRFQRSPRSFSVKTPNTKKERELTIAALMIYVGEGAKTGKTVDVANSNVEVHKIFLKFLREVCGVNEEKLRFYLYCFEDQNPKKLIQYWARELNVKEEAFTKPYIRKKMFRSGSRRAPYGVLHTRYNDKRLLEKILSMCSNSMADLSA